MHVVACVRISFLVEAKSYFIVWTDRICLTIHLSMDIWIASSFWLLEIMLLWTWVYKYLFQDLAFSSFGWAGLLNRKIAGNKCRRNCKYSKPPFLQPWMMYVSDDHRWPLRLLGEKFLIGRVTMDESDWCPLNPLANFNEKREGHTHRHRTNWLLCGYTPHGERHRYRQRTNEMLCVIWGAHTT